MLSKMRVSRFSGVCLATGFAVLSNFSLVVNGGHNRAIAQEYSGCFIVDYAGRVVNLNGMCELPMAEMPADAEPLQIIDGIALNYIDLIGDDSGSPMAIGRITNTTDRAITLEQMVLQFEDKETGDVVTTEAFNITAYLAPGQSREFRETLSKNTDLGGRNRKQLNPVFVNWK